MRCSKSLEHIMYVEAKNCFDYIGGFLVFLQVKMKETSDYFLEL